MVCLLSLGCLEAIAEQQSSAPSADTTSMQQATELNNRGVEAAKAGRFEEGTSLLRQAFQMNPADRQVQRNLAGVLADWGQQLVQQGRADRATEVLQEALQYDPEQPQALVQLGDLFYAKATIDRALQCWKRAYSRVPAEHQPAMAQRIAQAERDASIERGFASLRTVHFILQVEGTVSSEQMAALGTMLEQVYQRLAATLGDLPQPVSVILYTSRDFQRVIGQRDWALGLYDGRIRLRADDLGGPWVLHLISHELAHAWLAQTYGAQLPTWVHEGFAQSQEPSRDLAPQEQTWMEGFRTGTSWVPLKWLDRRFQRPSNREDVERAYLEARYVVATLLARYGLPKFRQFLAACAAGQPTDQAFDQVFLTQIADGKIVKLR